jgi:hypothetical protein
MQHEFLLSEPVAERRLMFLFPTTDGVTGKDTGVAGNKCYISKNGGAFVDTTNAAVQLTGDVTFPLYSVQLESDEVDTLGDGIVAYKDANSVWFAGIFRVIATSSELALDEVFAGIDKNRSILKEIQWNVNRVEKRSKQDLFINPLT